MNKKLLTVLTAAALVAALAACGENNPGGKQTTDTAPPASLTTQTEATSQTTEAAETTPPETTAPAPLPEVKDGTVYTKKAVDMFSGGDFDFLHSLTVPKIDSTKPGAEALNAKMLADQQEKLDALAAGKEGRSLYTVTYSASGADGILAINVYEYTGYQYSEPSRNRCFYYYDVAADRELTLDEVLTHLSLARDSLDKALVWSNGYELISIENTDRTITPAATVFGAPLTGAYDTPCSTMQRYEAATKLNCSASTLTRRPSRPATAISSTPSARSSAPSTARPVSRCSHTMNVRRTSRT